MTNRTHVVTDKEQANPLFRQQPAADAGGRIGADADRDGCRSAPQLKPRCEEHLRRSNPFFLYAE